MRCRLALSGLALSLLLGCGAPEPQPDPLARWPERTHLRAEGHGPTTLAAADDARARLAARIRARLTARLTVESTETNTGADERIERQIVTDARFDRAELIEVPPALSRCDASGCSAYAVLDRARATDALRDMSAAPSARLRAATAQARGADLPTFTRALRAADAAWLELAPLGWQRAAIEGGLPGDFTADRAAWRALVAEQARRLAALRVVVAAPSGVEAPWTDRIGDALVAGFAHHGLDARRGARCEDLVARPEAGLSCDRSALGPRCALTLRATLAPCEGAPLATIEFADAGLAAVDPRDEAKAEAALAARLDGRSLAPSLGRALSPVLPLRVEP